MPQNFHLQTQEIQKATVYLTLKLSTGTVRKQTI